MKNSIREQDIANVLGDKLGLKLKANNTDELNGIIDELIPVIDADWKEDVLTAEDFFGMYESYSPTASVNVVLPKDEARKLIALFDRQDANSVAFEDPAYEESYDTLDEVPTDDVYVQMIFRVEDAIRYLKEYTRQNGVSVEATLTGGYPLSDVIFEETSVEETFRWTIDNGTVTGGGVYELPLDDDEIFILRAHWLWALTTEIAKLNECGIDVAFLEA